MKYTCMKAPGIWIFVLENHPFTSIQELYLALLCNRKCLYYPKGLACAHTSTGGELFWNWTEILESVSERYIHLPFNNIIERFLGSIHDITVFNNSNACFQLERRDYIDAIIFGDSSYHLKNYNCQHYYEIGRRK